MRVKAKEPQDAQIILADALAGIPDKAHAAGQKIGQTAQRVQHGAIGAGIKGVDRQITAGGVLRDIGGKGHGGVAAIGGHIAAKGRHLMRAAPGDDGQRAVVDTGGDHLESGAFGNVRDGFRSRIGAKIKVGHRQTQQRVAHAAADQQGLKPLRGQRGAQGLRAGMVQPIAGDLHHMARSANPRRIRAVAPQM